MAVAGQLEESPADRFAIPALPACAEAVVPLVVAEPVLLPAVEPTAAPPAVDPAAPVWPPAVDPAAPVWPPAVDPAAPVLLAVAAEVVSDWPAPAALADDPHARSTSSPLYFIVFISAAAPDAEPLIESLLPLCLSAFWSDWLLLPCPPVRSACDPLWDPVL